MVLTTGLLLECQRDYHFHTVARYEAPLGRYEIAIEADGTVRAGADLSDHATAVVRITPAPGARGGRLHLQVVLPDRLIYTLDRGPRGATSWTGAGAQDTLRVLLQQAG